MSVVDPANLLATAYYAPRVATPILRRGWTQTFYQEESTEPGPVWNGMSDIGEWAQVATAGRPYTKKLRKPKWSDEPFVVTGDISDPDLVSLVAFVRSGPKRANRKNADGSISHTYGSEVNASNAISSITSKGGCYFVVSTESRPGAGQQIEIIRKGSGWEVYEVQEWVT